MADPVDEQELLDDLLQAAEAVGRLAEDEETFRAAVDAFRAEDSESLQELLGHHDLPQRCELICRWFAAKECVLLCLELCGPPEFDPAGLPDIREFADVVVRVTNDEELVELLAQAVEQRDADAWCELIEKQQLERFCHLLCHWACVVHWRLVCEVVCAPPVSRPHLIAELQAAGEAIQKLAANEEAFSTASKAVIAQDCDLLRATIVGAELDPYCGIICEWFCSWHCILVCLPFCRPFPFERPTSPIGEMLEFAQASGKLAANPAALTRFGEAVAKEDSEAFAALVKEFGLERFCIQLCHWFCFFRCHLFCFCVCPPPPLITHVGNIKTPQINALGYAAGPSNPLGYTDADDKPGGRGDHPFGGRIDIRGLFNVANPVKYKVEFTPDPVNVPWQPIKTDFEDGCLSGINFEDYQRGPDGAGWYLVGPPPPPCPPLGPLPENNGMGIDSMGHTFLTQWVTPPPPDASEIYYLRLTVQNAAGDHESPVVPVRIDNVGPTKPDIKLQLQAPDGTRTDLGCCETVVKGNGNLVVITITASDDNFSQIAVSLLGGCGASHPIVDTSATPLSKTYNGDITDTGYPAPTEFLWDPFDTPGIDPCCYLVWVDIWDRAIVNNFWSGGHYNNNFHSLTIG